MNYIVSANIKNYKSIKDVSADFSVGLNIIIGQNGSGKTNFVGAMRDIANNDSEEEDCELCAKFSYNNEMFKVESHYGRDPHDYDETGGIIE